MQSYPLVNPVPGLPLSKPADRGLTCSAERVGHVYCERFEGLKLVISRLMDFL